MGGQSGRQSGAWRVCAILTGAAGDVAPQKAGRVGSGGGGGEEATWFGCLLLSEAAHFFQNYMSNKPALIPSMLISPPLKSGCLAGSSRLASHSST